MRTATLLKHGWRPIVSDAQAMCLLRHELKHHANWQQRDPTYVWSYRQLLLFKRGNWFKFVKNRVNVSVLLQVPSDESGVE